jgi:hypothetical protein
MELLRCYYCKKLLLKVLLLARGSCECGSTRVTGASPSSLSEHLQCLWWSLTVRE